jgi:hypothetical protein
MAPRKTTKQSSRKQAIEIESTAGSVSRNGDATPTPPEPRNGSTNGNGARPSFDQLQLRAYEIFVGRGASHGRDWDDWFRAEQELSGSLAGTY